MSRKDGGQKGESINSVKKQVLAKREKKGILNLSLNTVRWMKAIELREWYPTT